MFCLILCKNLLSCKKNCVVMWNAAAKINRCWTLQCRYATVANCTVFYKICFSLCWNSFIILSGNTPLKLNRFLIILLKFVKNISILAVTDEEVEVSVCALLLTTVSILLIAFTLPLSLFVCIKVSLTKLKRFQFIK